MDSITQIREQLSRMVPAPVAEHLTALIERWAGIEAASRLVLRALDGDLPEDQRKPAIELLRQQIQRPKGQP
jgi:hypothetical protein